MKILYYSPHPNLTTLKPTGSRTHMIGVIDGLINKGHEVIQVILGDINTEEINTKKSLPHKSFGTQIKKLIPKLIWETLSDIRLIIHDRIVAKQELSRAIEKYQPDLIYERANYLQTSGVNLAKKHNLPHFLEMNGPYVEQRVYFRGNSLLLFLGKYYERYMLKKTNRIFSISETLSSALVDRYSIDPDKFVTAHMAVDLSKIKVDFSEVNEIKKKYKFTNNTVFGFVGSIFQWSGIEMLIEAFLEVNKQNPNTRLLIIGDGVYLKEIQKRIDLNSTPQIIFTGWVPNAEIYNYIECIDVPVLTNFNWYSSPTKVFEYGVLGKTMIVPGTGPILEIMNNLEDGYVVTSDSEEQVISAMKKSLNEDVNNQMGKRFKEKIKKIHTWENRVSDILLELDKFKMTEASLKKD